MNAPRLLTTDDTRQLLWHFTGDREPDARLLERAPKAALTIALGLGIGRLLDGMTLTWALARVFEHRQAAGVDTTPFLEAQAGPAAIAHFSAALAFLDAARALAQNGKDIPL